MREAADPRVGAARDLLRRNGIDCVVEATGPRAEIATIRAEPAEIGRLRDLAPDLRALGFRYVALDLTADPEQR